METNAAASELVECTVDHKGMTPGGGEMVRDAKELTALHRTTTAGTTQICNYLVEKLNLDVTVRDGKVMADTDPLAVDIAQTLANPLSNLSSALTLSDGDQPVQSLSSVPFNGTNYFSWSHGICISLLAKGKLGFINGELKKPAKDSTEYKAWVRVDAMVMSWILHSIAPELFVAFVFATSAQDLWERLKKRYGQYDMVQIYQLKKDIYSLKQGDDSVTVYHTKLRKSWDELMAADPPPVCSCDCRHKFIERQNRELLFQFLIGLNDAHGFLRCQILFMDPLPSINKAFSMIFQIESLKEISEVAEQGAFARDIKNSSTGKRLFDKKEQQTEKRNCICEFCKRKGHSKDTCFKLHGIPDWYKEMTKNRQMAVNSAAGPEL